MNLFDNGKENFIMIHIEYKIVGTGWAVGKIGNGEKLTEFNVSYLCDSLKELAESAIEIHEKNFKTVVFMDEPGEHVLILNRRDKFLIEYELRWYNDWWTWNLIDENNFDLIFKGQTTVAKYVNQVRNVLNAIITELGLNEYRNKWIKHDFPIVEFEQLK